MKYPRKPIEEHKTYKILPSEYAKVRSMRKDGSTYKEIAKIYNVSTSTIYLILHPDARVTANKRSVKNAKERRETDPDFVKSQAKAVEEYIAVRRHEDPVFRKYHQGLVNESSKRYRERRKKSGHTR